MYTPKYFAESDLAELDRLVGQDAFATLVTVADGAPFVSHLPVLYRREGEDVLFRGHWARPNPQWRHGGEALLIVHGPHAYVSPSWYPDKESAARVPTWNYAVAHIHGQLQITEDTDDLAAIVGELSKKYEVAVGSDWIFDSQRDDLRVQLKGIVGFSLLATRVELKFKLSQNHPEANVRSVIENLPKSGQRDAGAVAQLMRGRIEQRPSDKTH
jgi:transcriptional regulator